MNSGVMLMRVGAPAITFLERVWADRKTRMNGTDAAPWENGPVIKHARLLNGTGTVAVLPNEWGNNFQLHSTTDVFTHYTGRMRRRYCADMALWRPALFAGTADEAAIVREYRSIAGSRADVAIAAGPHCVATTAAGGKAGGAWAQRAWLVTSNPAVAAACLRFLRRNAGAPPLRLVFVGDAFTAAMDAGSLGGAADATGGSADAVGSGNGGRPGRNWPALLAASGARIVASCAAARECTLLL